MVRRKPSRKRSARKKPANKKGTARAKPAPKARARAYAEVAALPGGDKGGAGAVAEPDKPVRLNRWLSEHGIASRLRTGRLPHEAIRIAASP